jgi:hypothetical protein
MCLRNRQIWLYEMSSKQCGSEDKDKVTAFQTGRHNRDGSKVLRVTFSKTLNFIIRSKG